MSHHKYIENPLSVTEEYFDDAYAGWKKLLIEEFKSKFELPEQRYKIPSINDIEWDKQQAVKNNTLVRFRCMIQDMWDPEFYMSVYAARQRGTGNIRLIPGCYRDVAGCNHDEELDIEHNDCKTSDRHVYYCVPIPGETHWVKQEYLSHGMSCQLPSTSGMSCSYQKGSKRPAVEECEEVRQVEPAETVLDSLETKDSPETEMKKIKTDENAKTVCSADAPTDKTSTKSVQQSLNFPLPGERGPAVIVKVYDSVEESSYKLNDVVEFIGILSMDPALTTVSTDMENNSDPAIAALINPHEVEAGESAVHEPPPSVIPRLHVLWGQTLQHNNALLHSPLPGPEQGGGNANDVHVEDVSNDKDDTLTHLLSVLGQATLGDQLAAQYLLANIISSIYSRKDVMAVGKFTLNISGLPADTDYANYLHQLLQHVLTKCHMIALKLDVLNSAPFIPSKDYTCHRLTAAQLQLSHHTQLLLDETQMKPGQLPQIGINNLKALGGMIQWQKLNYDFKYHQCEFTTDISTLILSDGKSILPSDYHVPLCPNEVCSNSVIKDRFAAVDEYLTPALLSRVRRFLTRCRLATVDIPDHIQQKIHEHFVSMRAANASTTAEHLHLLLVLARLLALSKREGHMSEATWEHAVKLEQERRRRCQQP